MTSNTIRTTHTSPISVITVGAISVLTLVFLYSIDPLGFGSNQRKKKKERKTKDPVTKKTESGTITTTTSNSSTSDEYDKNNEDEQDWSEHVPSHIKREVMKERRRREKLAYLAMKSPMYDNVQMIDSKGVTLAKISKKKAKWYVNKGLAHYCESPEDINENGEETKDNDDDNSGAILHENRLCIQLDFEPKDNSNNTIYHAADKENICVKCGRGDYHLMRHHIVPSAYRSLLPKKYKSHMSHDITLLCGDCHVHCQQACQKRMNEIEAICRPPGSATRYMNDENLYKVRSSALALLNWKHKIPEKQLKVHYRRVSDYLLNVKGLSKSIDSESSSTIKNMGEKNDDSDWITNAHLPELIDMEYRIENPDFIPGPELVIGSIIDDEDKIAEFVKDWRRFFIDSVHPRFLPEGWSIDFHVTSNS